MPYSLIPRLFLCLAIFSAALLGVSRAANAHFADQSYIFFDVTDTTLTAHLEATLGDLDQVIGLDADADGVITKDEALAKETEIFDYLLDRLEITAAGQPLQINRTQMGFLELPNRTFVKAGIALTGFETTPDEITVTFDGFYGELKNPHKFFGIIANNTRTGLTDNEANIAAFFGPQDRTQTISLVGLPWFQLFMMFIIQGVWHIWLGFDHVLFLATLLIPAVMVVVAGRWEPEETLRAPLIKVAKLVTAFTLAHSVTLSLAALDIIRLPGWIVETIIAASIAFVAATILVPRWHRNMFWIVVLFGFFHGFGFANVLAPINIEPNQKFLTLGGFNIGVELGQLAIVLLLFPFLYALRTTWIYRVLVMKVGAVLLILIALVWAEERALDLLGPVKPMIKSAIGLS